MAGEARRQAALFEIGAVKRQAVTTVDGAEGTRQIDIRTGRQARLRVKTGRITILRGAGLERVDLDPACRDGARIGRAVDHRDAEQIGNAGRNIGATNQDVIEAQIRHIGGDAGALLPFLRRQFDGGIDRARGIGQQQRGGQRHIIGRDIQAPIEQARLDHAGEIARDAGAGDLEADP
ncbi:hypothetical protein D3C71_1563100 [compost metagenome]